MNHDEFERVIRELHETPGPWRQLRRLPAALLRASNRPWQPLAAIGGGLLLLALVSVPIGLAVDGRGSPTVAGAPHAAASTPSSASAAERAETSPTPRAAPSDPTTAPDDDSDSDPEATREAGAEATRQADSEAEDQAAMEAQIEADYQATMRAIDAEQRAWDATRTAQDLTTYCNPYMEDNTCD